MSTEPNAETNCYNVSTMLDSEDEVPATSWSELSIIERVGLNSAEMSEKDVETAFSQIALAFRCDQYTLKQRLQAEEHARNLAEENIQLELSRGRETLETLKGLCLDSKRSKILQRLQLSLDILGGTVERISNTAEVLGAVHQEARVSRAVELMVAHVENLRRRHDRNVAELEEAKKLTQQQSTCRNIIDPRASPEPQERDNRRRGPQQNNFRRRISASIISPTQEKRKKGSSSKKSASPCPSPSPSSESSCSAVTKDDSFSVDGRPPDPDETPPEASAAPNPPEPDAEGPPPKQVSTRKTQSKSSSVDGLRQRHKAALSKRAKEKKTGSVHLSEDTCESTLRQRPVTQRLYRRRWALICTYLFVLFCLTYFLWKLHSEAFEP